MTAGDLSAIERYLHEHIPLTTHMEVGVDRIDGTGVRLTAPLAPNINHRQTAFGGSVAALRLSEKGYRVLVLEQGSRFRRKDFAKTNWNLRRWLWMPALACRGILRMTFFRHVTVLSGVGVGGGSLVYANTLPQPKNCWF